MPRHHARPHEPPEILHEVLVERVDVDGGVDGGHTRDDENRGGAPVRRRPRRLVQPAGGEGGQPRAGEDPEQASVGYTTQEEKERDDR